MSRFTCAYHQGACESTAYGLPTVCVTQFHLPNLRNGESYRGGENGRIVTNRVCVRQSSEPR